VVVASGGGEGRLGLSALVSKSGVGGGGTAALSAYIDSFDVESTVNLPPRCSRRSMALSQRSICLTVFV
jgi:hypothetical protein